MTDSIIIAGNGPSAYCATWPDLPIMAISSGYQAVPDMAHFVSLDKPMHFPAWLLESERIAKHVADNKWAERWRQFPNVTAWKYEDAPTPTFSGADWQRTAVTGPLARNDSLLFGVQVAAFLDYKRCIFIGCDLLENERWSIADQLQQWQPIAAGMGIEWLNASPISALKMWMPTYTDSPMVEV